jgi:hypothetical protein
MIIIVECMDTANYHNAMHLITMCGSDDDTLPYEKRRRMTLPHGDNKIRCSNEYEADRVKDACEMVFGCEFQQIEFRDMGNISLTFYESVVPVLEEKSLRGTKGKPALSLKLKLRLK